MDRIYSQKLRSDARSAVRNAVEAGAMVNVPYLAELVRVQNLAENVAREDVERLIVQQGQTLGVAMAFASEFPDAPMRTAAE